LSYKIEFVNSAAKQFRKLSIDIRNRVLTTIRILRIDPFSEILNIRKIRGRRDLYRLRIGDYRLIYSIEDQTAILIIRIRHRKDAYRGL